MNTTILGAGLAGSLMAIMLARRKVPVQVFERRADPRQHKSSAGRSINLALADRGLHALKQAGLFDVVQPLLIPMRGRCMHDLQGNTQFMAYGQRAHEVIYSVSRSGLNALLLDQAEALQEVTLQFDYECTEVNLARRQLQLRDASQTIRLSSYAQLIAADGYASVARAAVLNATQGHGSNQELGHGYKELTLPADAAGRHQLDPHALHIWPRGEFMLIALPNLDGSFTVTLFLPFESTPRCSDSFAQLHDAASIDDWFARHFPDALALMPELAKEFMSHPTGHMNTVRSSRWTDGSAVLIGDAAHAIVPFHGQGMNCAFEDCVELDALLQRHGFAAACARFEQHRKPQANAIADMALENYIEMRDTVRHPKFSLHKQLAFELERLFPQRFIPRYSMVMFHHEIPYAEAYERGAVQNQLLEELTAQATQLDEVDLQWASRLVCEKLSELPPQAQTIKAD